MMGSEVPCRHTTDLAKRWPYNQYYVGKRDEEMRKAGKGEHHWSGAESLESYTGNFLQDTMHGVGTYRWRFKGSEGTFATYEGHFYGNTMHGYGRMSYDDGRYFTGLFHHNLRWGPGVLSHACLREDVGFWRGNQLLRIPWRPETSNVALDLGAGPNGNACIKSHRKLLATDYKIVREVNSAIELLKQCGSHPLSASEKWPKLYPKQCNDLASSLCNVKEFDYKYYKGKIRILEEVNSPSNLQHTEINKDTDTASEGSNNATYYAWNNNATYIHMMNHCYKHEMQRSNATVHLEKILVGPRTDFKGAGKHELDCRTALMASYLGHVTNVVQLVNELNVHPDVSDYQGNNCIMYAACGDQADIIHFLKEAGGNIDSFNDCCVTPLGIAIIRYLCTQWEITASGMVQALLPPAATASAKPTAVPAEELISEWKITRELPTEIAVQESKATPKSSPSKRMTKAVSTVLSFRKKSEKDSVETKTGSDREELYSEETRLYNNINTEFTFRVNDLFTKTTTLSPMPYLFEVKDLAAEIEMQEGKTLDKNPKKNVSKVIKPSKSAMWQSSRDDVGSIDSLVKAKMESLFLIMPTVKTLLSDGADPRLVRCPQPALFLAVMSGSSELVKLLIDYGADVNETFPQYLDYSTLDIAIAQPLCNESLSLAKTLLECGAECNHRLRIDPTKFPKPPPPAKGAVEVPTIPTVGPTLLHAVLAKSCTNEMEIEIQRDLSDLLLQYSCDPLLRYKGRSAIDVAISKSIDLFETFIKYLETDLNATINDANETVLLKMFIMPFCNTIPSAERLMILTNLLLYGADPFIECQIGEETYKSLFVYTKKILNSIDAGAKSSAAASGGGDIKKVDAKSKKDLSVKSKKSFAASKMGMDVLGDYGQALDLVVECARILLVRWLQAKLYVQLLAIVKKYKHRPWNMIISEHKNKKTCGLWLTSLRCIEIWDIINSARKTRKITVDDRRVLKLLLCIVQLYCMRQNVLLNQRVTTEEKDKVESQVKYIMYEHRIAEAMSDEEIPLTRPYVMPELKLDCNGKYNVCFDCLLPLEDEKIECFNCKIVSFCGFECMRDNIERAGCHPCSEILRLKYFPSPEDSLESDPNIL